MTVTNPVKGLLDWVSITFITGGMAGSRLLRWPLKDMFVDPFGTDWLNRIKTQGPSLTNHYLFYIGAPYSDAPNQVWRTFPLQKYQERNNPILGSRTDSVADGWLSSFTSVWLPTDVMKVYFSWHWGPGTSVTELDRR